MQLRWLICGALCGVLLFGLVRFAWQPSDSVHYHASFAVFINGERILFKDQVYYQEIASCNTSATPQSLVHMHDQNNHIVHVHRDLMTWADFFAVLGWSLNDRMVFDGKKAYLDGQGGRLQFILNNRPTYSVANEVIKSEDRLLISFSNQDQKTLGEQYAQIPRDAGKFNATKDPAACRGPEDESLWRRIERALWF